MPTDTSPLQRWILESQQELLKRLVALAAPKNSHPSEPGVLLGK
jgi:hypothetical protein